MNRYFLVKSGFLAAVVATAALAFAASGCGGSDESSSEITVQAGSLSKAEFTAKADAICQAARSAFDREYNAFVRSLEGKKEPSEAELETATDAIVKTVLLPNYEKGIEQIAALGAPSNDVSKVEEFLDALQQRLGEIGDRPVILASTVTPFARVEKLARSYGLAGCAASLS
jgi:hypothetical protein